MRPDLQQEFIGRVTAETHQRLCTQLEEVLGTSIDFRVCEMPIFVSHSMRQQLEQAAIELTIQCSQPHVIEHTAPSIPEDARVPHTSPRPLFSVVDFAITRDSYGEFVPKLIELQGFPSLYGYQLMYTSQMQNVYELKGTTPFCSDLTFEEYIGILRECIYGQCEPSAVALVELDPLVQKTRPDFVAYERLIGLSTVNIRDIKRHDRSLIVDQHDGQEPVLQRVFNRAIVDELNDMHVPLQFAWTDDLDVQWAGHPNWYYLMSKAALPYLDHPTVPRTQLVDQIDTMPATLEQYVLKPLYAFAGKGVVVGPTEADLQAIPQHERSQWILQERIEYARCVPTPYGDNAVEIRIMCVWPDRMERPLPIMSLARTGRGVYMGARYNTEPWTGSSGCLFV